MRNYPLAVTVDDACGRIGIGRSKFYQLVAEGQIRIIKIGRRTLVRYEELESLLNSADQQHAQHLKTGGDG